MPVLVAGAVPVLMIAMMSVLLLMGVLMGVFMGVRMSVRAVVMGVSMGVMIAMVRAVIMDRSVIGLEGRHHHRGRDPVRRDQRLGLGGPQHPHPVGQHRDRHMAVAERQEEARHGGKIRRPQFEDRLGIGHDFNKLSVVEHQNIVGAQAGRLRKVEFDAGALAAEDEALLPAPIIEFEQQGVGDRSARFAVTEDSLHARHGQAFQAPEPATPPAFRNRSCATSKRFMIALVRYTLAAAPRTHRRAGRSPPASNRTTAAARSGAGGP